ncbi:hypothetical protein [Allocoleopsis sp.]|jgi:hypothetical protein|uniref:hypothetical protein n=1 Tax=Allocoleopsis sp. TaxID=3088169 RepID=UPI002FCF859A
MSYEITETANNTDLELSDLELEAVAGGCGDYHHEHRKHHHKKHHECHEHYESHKSYDSDCSSSSYSS